jgi:hypothetical protein
MGKLKQQINNKFAHSYNTNSIMLWQVTSWEAQNEIQYVCGTVELAQVICSRTPLHFSPTCWVLIWIFKRKVFVNDPEHFVHLYSFSMVCILFLCLRRLAGLVNLPEHSVQLNGFSPVWIRLWFRSVFGSANDLLHTEQQNGFSPVWVSRWCLRSSLRLNSLLQIEQL